MSPACPDAQRLPSQAPHLACDCGEQLLCAGIVHLAQGVDLVHFGLVHPVGKGLVGIDQQLQTLHRLLYDVHLLVACRRTTGLQLQLEL